MLNLTHKELRAMEDILKSRYKNEMVQLSVTTKGISVSIGEFNTIIPESTETLNEAIDYIVVAYNDSISINETKKYALKTYINAIYGVDTDDLTALQSATKEGLIGRLNIVLHVTEYMLTDSTSLVEKMKLEELKDWVLESIDRLERML